MYSLKKTLYQLVVESAEKFPSRDAIVCIEDNVRVTFSELKQKVDSFAGGLAESGVSSGDNFVIWGPNCLEWIVAQYAVSKVGAIFTGLNPTYSPVEAAQILNQIKCNTILCLSVGEKSTYGILRAICPDIMEQESGKIQCKAIPTLRRVIVDSAEAKPGTVRMEELMSTEQTTSIQTDDLNPDDIATLQLTSGTTGQPKSVSLTHSQIISSAYMSGTVFGSDKQTHKLCMPGPLFRCGIMVGASVTMALFGTTLVLPSRMPNPMTMLKAVQDEKCTVVSGNPPMIAAILKHPQFSTFDLSSLEIILIGGAKLSAWMLGQVKEKINPKYIFRAVLMTEASGMCIHSTKQDTFEQIRDTDGKPIPGLEAKIVGVHGESVEYECIGELFLRGPNIMKEYFNNQQKSNDALEDGWLKTGDLASMTEDGFVTIVDRKNDIISRNGNVVYPSTIEAAIRTSKAIADVQVVGVPGQNGEEICAFVKCNPGAETVSIEDIGKICQESRVDSPTQFMIVDEFPRTPTKKVQKYKLRELFLQQNRQN
ncbi:unnamed protein product [Owenia fusiformis]|uniref:Medium-chain acyl-CoA ligase ACSF2, mitochondrial n=1 Tax=Owenia fusiformis TaxID=6347 RepID=A0A8J1ULW6_OWEFU|nr:unnamed protein product [Owenia fusiformis]